MSITVFYSRCISIFLPVFPPAERSLCTDTTSGKPKMAAKRKGGLKLNAICAKLSRQVVYDSSSQNAEGDQSVAENSERGSSYYDDNETNFPESLSLSQSLEEDQKRREAIEKWVNGEYGEEPPVPDEEQEHELRVSNDEDGPPEGVYMVQPKGCSDEEDNGEEAEATTGSQDGSYHDDKETDERPPKDNSHMPPSEGQSRQASFSSPGKINLTSRSWDILENKQYLWDMIKILLYSFLCLFNISKICNPCREILSSSSILLMYFLFIYLQGDSNAGKALGRIKADVVVSN